MRPIFSLAKVPVFRLSALFGLLLAFGLSALLTPAVRADNEAFATATATALTSPVAPGEVYPLDEFSLGQATGWMSEKNLTAPTLKIADGVCYLTANALENADGGYTLMRLYGVREALSLLNYANIASVLKPEGEGTFTVRLSLYCGLSAFHADAKVTAGGWYSLSADISAWPLRTAIDALTITITEEEGATLTALNVSSLGAFGTPSLDIADAFLTFGFTADGGTAEYEDGVFVLDAEADGFMSLVADAARDNYDTATGIMALKVVLDNAVRGGTLSLSTSDAFAGVSTFTIASSAEIQYGLNTYLLPFDATRSLRSFRLSFRNLSPDFLDAEGVRLLSVSLVHLPKETEGFYVGKVSSCAFSADMSALTVTGSLPSGTVADFIDGSLALYEIPMWSDLETVLMTDSPVATVKISTRFTFSVDLAGREAAAVSRYAVVLVTESGAFSVDAPLYPSFPTASARPSRSLVGLSEADPAGAFTANAANVIVDLSIDRLLGGSEGVVGGRLATRGGRYYYLDYAYLKELDAVLEFYSASDVDVYLRLLCETDLSERNFTFSGEGAAYYAFDVTNPEGAYMLSAVVDYIAARYSDLRGFIVGARLDDLTYNAVDTDDTAFYATLCADTMRTVYTAAAVHIPDVTVIAPMGQYAEDGVPTGAQTADALTPAWLSVLLSKKTEEDGGMPFGILYVSDDSGKLIGSMSNMLSAMKAMRTTLPDSLFLLWRPTADYTSDILLSEYAERCRQAAGIGTRVLFLQLTHLPEANSLYEGLKYVDADVGGGRHVKEFSATVSTEAPTPQHFMGSYALYDFTDSFSTLNWIAGSGCQSLTTQLGKMRPGDRSMHAQFLSAKSTAKHAVSGSILCMLSDVLDLTPAPTVVYTVLVTADDENTTEAEITFLFGSDDARAEYKVQVPVGSLSYITCDLSLYEERGRITSSAILVQASGSVRLDVSNIVAYSETADTDTLARHFETAVDSDPGSLFALTPKKAAILLFAVGTTLSVYALLSRKKRESTPGRKR